MPGDRFGAHCDAAYHRDSQEKSFYTANIYLNDVLAGSGGATRFWEETTCGSDNDRLLVLSINPEAGLGVLFRQPSDEFLLHDGEELKSGLKYLFRSDVMYRKRKKEVQTPE